jgi:hypothetical protein
MLVSSSESFSGNRSEVDDVLTKLAPGTKARNLSMKYYSPQKLTDSIPEKPKDVNEHSPNMKENNQQEEGDFEDKSNLQKMESSELDTDLPEKNKSPSPGENNLSEKYASESEHSSVISRTAKRKQQLANARKSSHNRGQKNFAITPSQNLDAMNQNTNDINIAKETTLPTTVWKPLFDQRKTKSVKTNSKSMDLTMKNVSVGEKKESEEFKGNDGQKAVEEQLLQRLLQTDDIEEQNRIIGALKSLKLGQYTPLGDESHNNCIPLIINNLF